MIKKIIYKFRKRAMWGKDTTNTRRSHCRMRQYASRRTHSKVRGIYKYIYKCAILYVRFPLDLTCARLRPIYRRWDKSFRTALQLGFPGLLLVRTVVLWARPKTPVRKLRPKSERRAVAGGEEIS